MPPGSSALAEYVDRPKGLADLTTAALWPVTDTPRIYLGPEIVKIVCGESASAELGRSHNVTQSGYFYHHISNTFMVHKTLLCRYSRYFREKLYGSLEQEVVAEALIDIEKRYKWQQSTEDVLSGYVPSWVALIEEYQRQAREPTSPTETEQSLVPEQQSEETIQLPRELKEDIVIFVHWLYTQQIDLEELEPHLYNEIMCARLYSLAERLDVPALRMQCYDALHKHYTENNTMPEPEVIKVILEKCQATSLLRKYIVATIAYEVIENGSESKETCDPILVLDKDFAAEVALEIMNRLRSDESSKDPNEEAEFDVDDSDSDISSSIDVGSDIVYDSDGYMTISEGEEEESVIGDAPERHKIVAEAPQSSSELSSIVPDQDIVLTAVRQSKTNQSLPNIKVEDDFRADRVLLDINANKRKRADNSFGDDENPRSKRPETKMADDVDFVDLTEWANSD